MKFDLGHIKKVVAVNVELDGKEPSYHYLILKKTKTEIDFGKHGIRINDLDALVKEVGTNHPILLHFTGKGILNRKTKFQENYRHTILLNANLSDFYFSDFLTENSAFSSVIRRDIVDETINHLTEKKLQIISISSGPFHTAFLSEILNKKELVVDQIILSFEENELVDFKKAENSEKDSILLGEERLSQELITCAALGAVFFNPNEKVIFPENEMIFQENYEEAKQKNIFTRFGMGMMLFFLTILFANYLYVGHLNKATVENSVYLEEYNDQLTQISVLEEEKMRKEKLLQSSGLLNRNFLSFYLMEMANSVPKEITFDEVVLRPLKDEIKQRQKIAFEEHLLLVNGRSKTSHILSQWIKRVQQEEWLSNVEILDYAYQGNEGYFELEMIVL